MKNKILLSLVVVLAIIIIVLILALIFWPLNKNADVKNLSVKSGQQIESPLLVSGQARGTWFFEATFPIKIIDEQGNILGSSFVRAKSDWMTEDFVEFEGELTFSTSVAVKGFLVLSKDNPSGLPQYDKELRIPVNIKPSGMMIVKAFFNNNNLDPQISCNKVFAIERQIPKVSAVGSAAIWELLKGPTAQEEGAGFFTSINNGVKLQSLEITKEGTAIVDFNSQLEYQVGGSCRVSSIRAQISETLKQFSTVKNVVISINGRTEDILQP